MLSALLHWSGSQAGSARIDPPRGIFGAPADAGANDADVSQDLTEGGQQMNRVKTRTGLRVAMLFGCLAGVGTGQAHHTETHFEDRSTHQVVYQFNKADAEYMRHVLFSVGALLRKYGDDIEIVVEAFGPGIHILGKHPLRPVPDDVAERVRSLQQYGVAFHACGNTMSSLNWSESDLLEFAKVVESGADDMLLLQEKGFGYISW